MSKIDYNKPIKTLSGNRAEYVSGKDITRNILTYIVKVFFWKNEPEKYQLLEFNDFGECQPYGLRYCTLCNVSKKTEVNNNEYDHI